jgi:hypothetical protein
MELEERPQHPIGLRWSAPAEGLLEQGDDLRGGGNLSRLRRRHARPCR